MRSVPRLYAVLKTSLTALLVVSVGSVSTAVSCPQDQIIQPCKCSERSNEIQIWCSYGDLNSITNSLKLISQMIPKIIDELILENNLLLSLPGQMFSSIKVLRLMLRENGLQRISSNWLAGVETTLQEIYIVEPELRSFPDDLLVTLPKLEALTLSAGLITKIPAIFGLSRLRYIQIEASSVSEIVANNFQGLPFLEQLHITSALRLRRLDEDTIHDLPKLSVLNFTQCGLSYIHPRALTRLPALTELSFSNNKFTDARTIGMAIRDLRNLATVRLDRNEFTRLEEGTFLDMSSLTNLYLNENKIVNIYRAAFHRLPRLRLLDLSNNEIRMIHPESFLPAKENVVEELWLNKNQIEHSVTIRVLLDSLPNLRLLDMSNNFLEEINYGIVHNHLHLEMLILENNKLQKLNRESFIALPSLRELKLGNNSLAYHLGTPYWNLPALKGLDLSRNNFEHVDRYLLNGLPSLRRFDISHNLLKTIEPATFVGNPFLEHVNISRNNLQLLSSLTFSQLHRLFDLDISNNNLTQGITGIPRNVEYLYMANNNMMVITTATMHEFQLSSLKLLDLSGNKIHNIPATSLSALCTLRTLLLNDNSLQVIDQLVFENLPQLRKLNLANNKLIMIKKDSFKKLQHLNELNLRKNRLEIFEPDLLTHNPDLRKLDLSGNRLVDLASNVFASNKKIEDLNLSENLLSEFPSSISGMSSLQIINLSRNKIKSIPSNVLPTVPALKELYVSGNKLPEVPYGVFERLQNLSMIDFENNEIQQIGMRALHSLPNLVMVKMSKNKISTVARSAFENLPMLQSVELQENELKDITNNAFTACPSLLMLNLSSNMLATVDNGGLHGLKTLEALDLSHNKISTLTMESVKDLNYLVLLKLDNNRLCNIEGTPFEKMFRLRMLSLRDNKMTSLSETAFNKLRSSIVYFDIEGNPVKCSCNMLWLQSWLQQDEQRLPGPRCSDGILLREHRISKNNCDDILDLVPGCETKHGNVPNITIMVANKTGIASAAQVLNSPKLNMTLKPLPEETDYFDPKFIEYHENNSKPIAQNKTQIPPEVLSHFISGDTPTLYAGMRQKENTTKNNVKPQSSSAFTFFGVPLPSLNLNNFWNSGKSLDKSKKHGRYELGPPTQPDIQKDGFVPVLPGTGGFVPMNVTENRNSSGHRVTGHATISKVSISHNKPDDEDNFFDDLDAVSRTNRNVSHRDLLFEISSHKPATQDNSNHTEIKYKKDHSKETIFSEPVFSFNERVNEESDSGNRTYDNAVNAKSIFKNVTTLGEKIMENVSNIPFPFEFSTSDGRISVQSSTGRPIISKIQLTSVPSSHSEDVYSSHLKSTKNTLESSTMGADTTIKRNTSDVKNWYFKNYNRSNIEPFVGRLPIKLSYSYQNHPLLPLFFSGLFIVFIF